MRALVSILNMGLLSGCAGGAQPAMMSRTFVARHMKNMTRLTFEGDSGEAYFSHDGKKLIFQSNRGGYLCDTIWIMNIDGSDRHMVSPDHGADTCSFFLPGDQKIIFASTSHIPGDCPPRPDLLASGRYVWPLFSYDIFTANTGGGALKRLTDNPKYDAEPSFTRRPAGRVRLAARREFRRLYHEHRRNECSKAD